MATCKDCLHYGACKEYEKVMLTVSNLFELMFQSGVEASCNNFKSTADVAEVKHGEWVDNTNGTFTCTACGNRASKMKWCGNCGAKMDGGTHDKT